MKKTKLGTIVLILSFLINLLIPYSITAVSTGMPPTVETRDATNVGQTSATLNGVVTAFNVDGENTSEVGFYYCIYGTGNYVPKKAGTTVTKYTPFSVTVTGLTPGTRYSFYAYAINSKGIGKAISSCYFTTTSTTPQPPTIPSTPPTTTPTTPPPPTTTPVTSVNLIKNSTTISTGSSEMLIATVNPSNATNKNIRWESSNPSIATVDSTGSVTGINSGTAVIIVTTVDGSKFAYCNVTVQQSAIPVESISLNKTSITISPGASDILTATVNPPNATNRNIRWTSDNTSIATVDSTGVVTGVNVGTAVISVKTSDSSKSTYCIVTVQQAKIPVESVSLNKTSITLSPGSNDILTATVSPTNATNTNLRWESNDTSIAVVDSSGRVTGISAGAAAITVTTEDGSKYAYCTVSVDEVNTPKEPDSTETPNYVYYPIANRTVAPAGTTKIQCSVVLPSTSGIDNLEKPEAVEKSNEAAYHYVGIEIKKDKDKLTANFDYGLTKANDSDDWSLFCKYTTNSKSLRDKVFEEFKKKGFKVSSSSKNGNYSFWASGGDIMKLKDDTKASFSLSRSGTDKVTLVINNFSHTFTMTGITTDCKYATFRRVASFMAYGENNQFIGLMKTQWQSLSYTKQNKVYEWKNSGTIVSDNKKVPKNITVRSKDLPRLEVISFGQD